MRFTVSQSSLAKALSVVSKGIATHSTIPVLGGILMRASNGTLEMQASDLDTSIRHKIAANVEEEGETVISGRMLNNIVKNLADAAVTFDGGEGTIHLTCEKSSFHLNTLNASEFPSFPEVAMERSVELPCDALSEMVDKVYKVTSRDTSRPILAGVLLNVEENLVRLVATDSYRLVVCDTNVETSKLDGMFEMIIPGTAFHDVLSLPSDAESIIIGATSNQVVFVFGNTTYVSRRIEGTFPNYKQLLPSTCLTSVKTKVSALAGALRRVSSIATSNSSVRFDADVDGGAITLSSTSPDQGDAREVVPVDVEGQPNSICMNYRYVGDCVGALSPESEVTLELQESMRPGVFKSYGKINYLYLLMPVRM
ncbi:DNA polymerase III subunit beta [uncultured Parolsenella sp.]|uniref:DNA polymerase III subunit beta n=1 Tax=uncultured Parolsenella sp. TaxID=2083008 RepID=UPI0025EFDDA2|nr:DNA polymerase III subunit beta [uncultured Parolsenella sp.]